MKPEDPKVSRAVAVVIVTWVSVSIVAMALAFVSVCLKHNTSEVKNGHARKNSP